MGLSKKVVFIAVAFVAGFLAGKAYNAATGN
jgi:hypothetical protein